jgi:hypothetical protein
MVPEYAAWLIILNVAVLAFVIARLFTVGGSQIDEVREAIWDRYKVDAEALNGDRPITYLYREADRQINKVRGILTFDGIFFVVARTDELPSTLLGRAALTYLLISIMVSLYLFIVKWGNTSVYEDFKREFGAGMQELRVRTFLVNYAVITSALAALAVSCLMLFGINLKIGS